MVKNMFLLGRNEGLRNRQLLMNASETDPTRRLVARHLGVFLDVFHPASVFAVTCGSHSSSVLTFPEGISIERDLAESTQASSVRWAIRLINDHYGPHRSPWYRRSSSRALAGDAGGSAAMARIATS